MSYNVEQRQIQLSEAESNQRQHNETLRQQELIQAAYDTQTMTPAAILKPRIFIDGNKWCVLWGENIQDGVCGFGDSPRKALMDFNASFDKKLPLVERGRE